MILGHDRQIEYLNKTLQKGRLAHAYLFYGPEGVGKFTVAGVLAEKLKCPNPVILDIKRSLTSEKLDRKDIPIEDIRELRRIFSLAPEGSKWRVAIINQAEKLSPPAGDAFLKLLEEPGTQTLFILVTSSRELLPPTIISRAQPLRFSLVPEKTLVSYLESKNVGSERRKEILWIAEGRPGVMLRLLNNPRFLEEEKKFVKEIYGLLAKKEAPAAFLLSDKIAQDEAGRCKTIAYILKFLKPKLPDLSTVSQLKNIHRLANILETTNVNPRLVLDIIFLEAIQN